MLVRITRRRAFEASHRYWLPDLSLAENQALFGKCISPHGHGHNYVCEATISGQLDPATGIVINVKDLDAVMIDLLGTLDHRFLNEEWTPLNGRQPTTEVLSSLLFDLLATRVTVWPVRVESLRLYETDDLWAETEVIANRSAKGTGVLTMTDTIAKPSTAQVSRDATTTTILTRAYTFSAAHRLHNPGLDDADNRALFGKCNNIHGHGHDYRMEVTVTGTVDARTGMIVDLGLLDRIVTERILDRWDHKHLNLDVAEFAIVNPTSENVIRIAWDILAPAIAPVRLAKVVLWETPKSSFEYRGPSIEDQSDG